MTTKAFVLIDTAVGQTRAVLAILRELKGVQSANAVTGPYDIIAVVKKETLSDIGDLVTSEVHPLDGVTRTVTCLVA
jgi:DNA-binding Lrp family transcriptional regulator